MTARDRLFPSSDQPVDWDSMFGDEAGTFARIAVPDIPELASAADQVCAMAFQDDRFEQGISLLSKMEPDEKERKRQIRFEYVRFVSDIISRAEAMNVENDSSLLDIYLHLERARFADELSGDLLVPIALTALDLDEPLQIAEGLWIERLGEGMQAARAVSAMYAGRVSAYVIAAATHAIVVRDVRIDNRNRIERVLRKVEIDLQQVDRVIQCLHISTGRRLGYAQAVVRPADWADDWEHDLPAVWKAGQYPQYPEEFDNGAWNQMQVLVPREDIAPLSIMFEALKAAPENVQLSARRAIRAVLRSDDEDRTLDACIGIEALLLGNNDRDEMTHRMAQRAAAALASDGYSPTEIYRLIKKVYEHRSAIVHGRLRQRGSITLGSEGYSAQDIGVLLLRLLLTSQLMAEHPWTPQSLDEQVLLSLIPESR
jgi:hypothetical protein